MRIGLFTHVYPPMINGVSVSTKTLEEELIKQGHDVFVITNNYNSFSNDFSNEHFLQSISIPIYYQNLRTPILYNPDLFKEIDKLDLDVIHSHSDFGIGLLSKIYSKINKKPNIQTYHCNYIEYANSNFGGTLGKISKNPVKLYTKYLSATTNRIIVPSETSYRLLHDEFNIKRDIDVIPNGINLDRFRDGNYNETLELKQKYGINEDDFVLLNLGRLSKEKSVDDIIKIIPYLKECTKLKVVIVGGGPEEENLKKLAKTLNLNNVIFTGEVDNKEVANYYRLATTFITNSIAETQGLTVIEALASSIPVVCVNNSLYSDIVIDNYNGAKYSNMSQLIQLIKQLYDNRDYIERIRENTELSVLKYSISETSKKIIGVYEEEISKKK